MPSSRSSPGAGSEPVGGRDWPSELVLLGAATRKGSVGRWVGLLATLSDDALLAAVTRTSMAALPADDAFRLAVVATSVADLRGKLRPRRCGDSPTSARTRISTSGRHRLSEEPLGGPGAVGFVFPGEGSQYVGMLAEPAIAFPAVRRWFDLDRPRPGRAPAWVARRAGPCSRPRDDDSAADD